MLRDGIVIIKNAATGAGTISDDENSHPGFLSMLANLFNREPPAEGTRFGIKPQRELIARLRDKPLTARREHLWVARGALVRAMGHSN